MDKTMPGTSCSQIICTVKAAIHRCSSKISVLKNFAKFTGKHKCQSISLIKFRPSACTFVCTCVFSENFWKFLMFLKIFTEHLQITHCDRVTILKISKNSWKIPMVEPTFYKVARCRIVKLLKTHTDLTKLTEKHLCQSLFKKSCRLKSCNFIKKRL